MPALEVLEFMSAGNFCEGSTIVPLGFANLCSSESLGS